MSDAITPRGPFDHMKVNRIAKLKGKSDDQKRAQIRLEFGDEAYDQAMEFLNNALARQKEVHSAPEHVQEETRAIPGIELLEDKPISDGGSSEVWKATITSSGDVIAVKIINNIPAGDDQRVEREVQLLQNLRHDNIVRYRGFEKSNRGEPCILMDLIEGETLKEDSKNPTDVVKIGQQIAGALHELHSLGFVHRDVKPNNIVLREDKFPILIDFGIAKDLKSNLTATGVHLQTPMFASPEQKELDKRLDHRSDIYSLGLTLQWILKRTTSTGIRTDLLKVIDKCLRKEPDDRYQSALELQNALFACDPRQRENHVVLEPAIADGQMPIPLANDIVLPQRRHQFRLSPLWKGAVVCLLLSIIALAPICFQMLLKRQTWQQEFYLAQTQLCNTLRLGFSTATDPGHLEKNRAAAVIYLSSVESRLGEMDLQPFLELGELYLAVARSYSHEFDRSQAAKAEGLLINFIDACDRRITNDNSGPLIEIKSRALHEIASLNHSRLNPTMADAQYHNSLQSWFSLITDSPFGEIDEKDWYATLEKWQPILKTSDDASVCAGIARTLGYLGDWYYDNHNNENAHRMYVISLRLRDSLVASLESQIDGSVAQQISLQLAKHEQLRAKNNLLQLSTRVLNSDEDTAMNCLRTLQLPVSGGELSSEICQAHLNFVENCEAFRAEIKSLPIDLESTDASSISRINELDNEVRNDQLSHYLDLDSGLIKLVATSKPDSPNLLDRQFEIARETASFHLPIANEPFHDLLTQRQTLICIQWQLLRLRYADNCSNKAFILEPEVFVSTAVKAIEAIVGSNSATDLPHWVYRLWSEVQYESALKMRAPLAPVSKFIMSRPETLRTPESRRLLNLVNERLKIKSD